MLQHPLYKEIACIDSLRLFMEHHVFAVWDFMSLLKTMQLELSCTSSPWLPAPNVRGCRLVNEIVLAEESDYDGQGGYASHFELYRRAMRQCAADTNAIDEFLRELRLDVPVSTALASPLVPEPSRRFVKETFRIIDSGALPAIASVFTFGREDLLPDVFQRFVDDLGTDSGIRLDGFQYYLERHIALDGEEHGPMSHQLLCSLCGTNEAAWKLAEEAAVDCLNARKALWDQIYTAIVGLKKNAGLTANHV